MSQADQQRYLAAMHAVQSGVALKMNWDPDETAPKQLRVGMNSALVSNGALIKLLIDKGVCTVDEFQAVLADYAEQEQASYEAEIAEHYGNNGTSIHLG
jgi:hypothetical protein